MKKIKFSLLFLFILSVCKLSFTQQVICYPSSHPYECDILNRIVSEYVCDSNVVVLYNGTELLQHPVQGITNQYSDTLYQISVSYYIDSYSSRIWTLCHEAGHLIDMVNGDLSTHPDYCWKGESVNNSMPYYLRPWEQSAEEWASILFFSIVMETFDE